MLISLVDCGRGDPPNIFYIIVHKDLETHIYKIAVQAGVLNGGCSRNQFDLCPPKNCLLKIKIKMSVSISLCLAVNGHSAVSVRKARVYEM